MDKFRISSFDWRWLLVTYCFLVLFHLLPSSLVSGLSLFRFPPILLILGWVGIGIVAVSTYVGFRSVEILIVEPGIVSLLYVVSLFFLLPDAWPATFVGRVITTPWVAAFLALAFLAGCLGAALGKLIQLRQQKKQAIAQKT